MAEENIIPIEEADVAGVASDEDAGGEGGKKGKISKKAIIIIAILSTLILIIIITLVILLSKDDKAKNADDLNLPQLERKLQSLKDGDEALSNLEKMIKKANLLYQSANKNEALKLFEQIAVFSQAISNYNLGVAQLQEKQYELALQSFKKAIADGENVCVSAINAAVAATRLKKPALAKYYIDLANSYLPEEADSPLYSYYNVLINYYKQNYLETLSPLKHQSSEYYQAEQNHIRAKIDTLFQSHYSAISSLEKNLEDRDLLTLGQLYARVGDVTLAKKYLNMAIQKGIQPKIAKLSLALINLKAGQPKESATAFMELKAEYGDTIASIFPIRVNLKESLFNIASAQAAFKESLKLDKSVRYQTIFYFAPYKIFDASKTINYIRKGSANIFINDNLGAQKYLKKSSINSKTNANIAKAISLALKKRVRSANELLATMVKNNPKHSILRYNLGLTYAQMGNMREAYTHFLRAYHLDSKNYTAGIFALMSADIAGKNVRKLREIIKENLDLEESTKEIEFYKTAIAYLENNLPAAIKWLDVEKNNHPLYLIFDLNIANQTDNTDIARMRAENLVNILKDDIMPHLLYIYTFYKDLPIKEFSFKTLEYLNRQTLDLKDIYYGSRVVQEMFIQYAQLTGKLHQLRTRLNEQLKSQNDNPIGILQALALTNIYTKNYEEAYTQYNQLIDQYKQNDAHTLFLAAIASIAADHHANAIALLELAKLKEGSHYESRYALGLLYLEIENISGASIQFDKMENNGFQSKFFNFMIANETDKPN